jgi:phospholipid/cholesterol/gamma-HCH transport system permease protein
MGTVAGFWDRLAPAGDLLRFSIEVLIRIARLRVFKFFGEALRQSGILILGSAVVIFALMFIVGTTCGIEGAYFTRATGAPPYAGVFTAWCDLREAAPTAFGYMMAAKVGTGLVAEIGTMRVTEEIDALDVMGIDSVTYLCGTRLLAAWMIMPLVYGVGVAACYFGSYLAVIKVVADTTAGGYDFIFWLFQNPLDLLYSLLKGMGMATLIVLVGCYYGYTARGGPVGVGKATAKSMVVNIIGVHVIGAIGTQIFWGANPRAPIGG